MKTTPCEGERGNDRSGIVAWACYGLKRKTDEELRELRDVICRLEHAEIELLDGPDEGIADVLEDTRHHLQRVRVELDKRHHPNLKDDRR